MRSAAYKTTSLPEGVREIGKQTVRHTQTETYVHIEIFRRELHFHVTYAFLAEKIDSNKIKEK